MVAISWCICKPISSFRRLTSPRGLDKKWFFWIYRRLELENIIIGNTVH
jgi:hypothetical protein